MKKQKGHFWWFIGYIATWLIFFSGVALWIYWWYNWTEIDTWMMKAWIWIAVIAAIFMGILHIVIFRLKWKTRELWINILKKIWKWIWSCFIAIIVVFIIDIIYGKIQYSKFPEVDESMFYRNEHNTPLPDEEDALIQLKKLENIYLNFNGSIYKSELWKNLSSIYSLYNWQRWSRFDNPYRENQVWWERNQDECIKVYSGDIVSCGSWVWNKETLDRIFNRYYNRITDNWETVDITIEKYLDEKESEIRSDIQELDSILSLDYYLPEDKLYSLIPIHLQNYSRGMSVALLYYTQKEDWNMVRYIVEVNNKITNLFNNLWGAISVFVSSANQDIVDKTLNSAMQLFPGDLRSDLAKFYEDNMLDREDSIHNTIKWEYAWYKEQIKAIDWDSWLFSKFPFYWAKDTKRVILYGYKLLYDEDIDTYNSIFHTSNIDSDKNYISWIWNSIYNIYGKSFIMDIMRGGARSPYDRIDLNISQKNALITNLKSGNYDAWFNEKVRDNNPSNYETYSLPTDEELAK